MSAYAGNSAPSVLAGVAAEFARRGLTLTEDEETQAYQSDPIGWIEHVLGEFAWSKQREIAQALLEHRRVAVKSCNSSGKSWLAGRLAAWFLSVHPPCEARMVTSAPTAQQVRGILWQEIRRAAAVGNLPGRINQTEWWFDNTSEGEFWAGLGRKPADMNVAAFQGFHAPNMLVIFDEADGIAAPLWNAADSLLASGEPYFLAIGNPVDSASRFAEVCRPGSGWHVITVRAWDTPNFTDEDVPDAVRRVLINQAYVDLKRRQWTPENPLWQSYIEAEFPEQSEDTLIPVSWVRRAQERTLDPVGPHEIGMDVGGGVDKTVLAERRGPVARIIVDKTTPDTMVAVGELRHAMQTTKAAVGKVDEIGIGRGTVDRCRELGMKVSGVNVARHARDPKQFANLRAEGFWNLREQFRVGAMDIDPEDEELAAQLCTLKYKRTSQGIRIEPKEEMKRRGLSSPDRADALMLAYIVPSDEFDENRFMSLPDW